MADDRKRVHTARWLLAIALTGGGCYDFHLVGPEDPAPPPVPRLVSVAVEYRQPPGCLNAPERCEDLVVFFGSWMRPGGEFFLQADAGGYLWTGVAHGVPVNFPPGGDEPHRVRVYDPHLVQTLTEGSSAERLKVGAQIILRFSGSGGRNEVGLIYIDENGQGRNPY